MEILEPKIYNTWSKKTHWLTLKQNGDIRAKSQGTLIQTNRSYPIWKKRGEFFFKEGFRDICVPVRKQ